MISGVKGIAAATTFCAGLSVNVYAQSFQGLGDLPGGSFFSVSRTISADGLIIVGTSTSASGGESFRWDATNGMVGLGSQLGSGEAYGVNADGSVIVGWHNSAFGREAFRWDVVSGLVGLGDLPGSIFWSDARGISANGTVIAGSSFSASSASFAEAFRWDAANGMIGLGDLPGGGFQSEAYGISADGSVLVGLSWSTSGGEAFRWDAVNGMIGLGDLPGDIFNSSASAVNADGSIIVGSGSSTLGRQAFRWDPVNGMVSLGFLPGGFYSQANALTADGSVVVGIGQSALGIFEAIIWDETNGLRNLREVLVSDYGMDLNGWILSEASGISADGAVIVGTGHSPDGFTEAWVARIPEPTSMALAMLGWLSLLLPRRLRRA